MNTGRTIALSATAALLLAGCGGGGDDKADQGPSLVRGAQGTRAFEGGFSNVKNPPQGTGAVVGTAEMIVGLGKTRVTILATGLDNKSLYVAHVHNGVCSATDPGGLHFKFDPNGGDQPPNEIHLGIQFEVDRKGTKKTAITSDVTVDREAGAEAKSVIIHLKKAPDAPAEETKPPKVACADLKSVG